MGQAIKHAVALKMRIPVKSVSAFLLIVILSLPAWATDKELVQLQTQVQNLQDQLSRLQRSLDENIGITTDRINHNAENIRQLDHNVREMQSRLTEHSNATQAEIDKISTELKTLQSAVSDVRNRLELATQPRAASPAPMQSGPVIQPTAPPAQPPSAQAPLAEMQTPVPPQTAVVQAPLSTSSDSTPANSNLYETAMEHYLAKDFESAANEFGKYLKTDHQSPKAVTAQFYLAEIEYQQQDFEGALDDYTDVGPRLSDPAKAATALYKKALCLLEVEREDEAVRELQSLLERYPHSAEASRAARKLRSLQRHGK